MARPNGVTSAYSYDSAGRLAQIEHRDPAAQLLARYTYTLDGVGNRTHVTETVSGATRSIGYTYDPLNRLTTAAYSTGENYAYQYDPVGNRTAYTLTTPLDETAVTTYTYDAANRLLVAGAPGHSVAYTWDARGNLLADGTFTYTYNAAGRMVRAESITATLVYTYNVDGLLVARSLNSALATFVWDLAAGLPVIISDSTAVYLHTFDGKFLAERRDGMWAYPLADSLGNVRQWSTEAGRVVGYVEYDPFGMQSRWAGTVSSPYGYTGEYHDAESAFIYLRARYYAPYLNRFISPDTIIPDPGNPQDLNRYSYVRNNPVRYTDPTGHCVFGVDTLVCIAVGGAVVGGIIGYGTQVHRNLQSGMDLGEALRTDISAEPIIKGALLGSTIAVGGAYVATALGVGGTGAAAAGGAATVAGGAVQAAGADGDYTNEVAPLANGGYNTLSRAADFGIKSFNALRDAVRGNGLQRHHIIEQRFAPGLRLNPGQMPSVVLTPEEHQRFTNLWHDAIPYINSGQPLNTLTATREQIWLAAQKIYADYPDLLEAAYRTLFGQ